jgi:hypothetical protein
LRKRAKRNNANYHILIFICVTMEQFANRSNLPVTAYAVQTALRRAAYGSVISVLRSPVIPAVGIYAYFDCGR